MFCFIHIIKLNIYINHLKNAPYQRSICIFVKANKKKEIAEKGKKGMRKYFIQFKNRTYEDNTINHKMCQM